MKAGMYAWICTHMHVLGPGAQVCVHAGQRTASYSVPRVLSTFPLATGLITEQATWTMSPRSVWTSSSPELGLQMHTMYQTFFFFKYRIWGLNLDAHAGKARKALYWVITPVPENQNVINISSAYFVSPRGCTEGEVLSSSLKKKKGQECRNRK